MNDNKRLKYLEVPFVIEGDIRINKRISKYTRCADIIAQLPNLDILLAVFVSVDGMREQLPNKTRLWKVWSANSSSDNAIEFVIRKSELDNKTFPNRKMLHESSKTSKSPNKKLSNLILKMRDLTVSEKSNAKKQSLHNGKQSLGSNMTNDTIMDEISSEESFNEMDSFLSKCKEEKVSLLHRVSKSNLCRNKCSYQMSNSAIQHGLKTTKLCLKKTLKSARSSAQRAISTGNMQSAGSCAQRAVSAGSLKSAGSSLQTAISSGSIQSTDTGYYSTGREGEEHNLLQGHHFRKSIQTDQYINKQHCKQYASRHEGHNHSTPIAGKSAHKTPACGPCTAQKAFAMKCVKDRCGKDVIMKGFMYDLSLSKSNNSLIANDEMHTPMIKARHTEGQNRLVTHSQLDKCLSLWNKYAESDSDTDESDIDPSNGLSLLNNTFCAGSYTLYGSSEPRRACRQKAAVTNLSPFSSATRSIDPNSDE